MVKSVRRPGQDPGKPGTGLAAAIASQHGGSLTVVPREPGGALFSWNYLPWRKNLMNRLFRVVGALGGLLGQAWGRFAFRLTRLLDICAMFHRLLLGAFIGPPLWACFFRELSRQVYFTAIRRAYILVFTSLMRACW